MPRGDGTGPAGAGSMTGRAAGFCAGYSVPGYMNPAGGRAYGGGFGRGRGMGRGFGRGFGWARAGYGYGASVPFPAAVTAQQELDSLKGQAGYLSDTLEGIKKRIEELEAQKSSSD